MKKVSLLLTAALLCSCSDDWSGGTTAVPATVAVDDLAVAAAGVAPAVAGARAGKGFANAPDRGALLQYPARGPVRRTGAYTWHAVELSEAHALRAAVSGEMRFTAPDGTPIRLAYERHVEHPDGNWSWIGRAAGGEASVITFGETAAFGSINQGRDKPPLRLTVADGRAWVVATDRSLLREIHNEATRPSKPDYFVPPKLSADAAPRSGMQALGAMPASATAAGNTVDVLVGYTAAFAAGYGGERGARSRIFNLVDITNQAYLDSQVNAEIRLVHTMQVNYPDATSNATALEGLTGFRAPSTQIDPAPEFSALRAAREQYGADLVTLVRQYNDPENEGCGIAWLIGGDRSGIVQNDEYFGYSVVSDGRDGGYFCREATFAHELGHNMGSTHDRGTSTDGGELGYGAYDYSFGQKTIAGAGNFYTIMAYGDTGQGEFSLFSNPRITLCGGLPCGVANEVDNARSLNQTIPIIATFRESLAPAARKVASDFDGDGLSDILWRNTSTGANTIWRSANAATPQAMAAVASQAWAMVGVGDFNGDGDSDVLWRNTSTGANTIWLSGNYATPQAMTQITDLAWGVAGVGDFDGDGKSDILWRHAGTGAGTIWRSGSYATQQSVARITDRGWRVVGVGDFNGDGESDILWRHAATGAGTIWRSGSHMTQQALTRVTDLAWNVVGVGDFNGDAQSDILWRHMNTGANTIWRSGSFASQQGTARVANLAWTVVDVADYNGDGQSDILWRNTSTGANTIWQSGNSASQRAVSGVANLAWKVIGN